MRALVLLFLVFIAFLVVVQFFPSADVAGAEGGGSSASEGGERAPREARFLTRPEPTPRAGMAGSAATETGAALETVDRESGAAGPAVSRPAEVAASQAQEETAEAAGDEVPSWLSSVERPVDRDPARIRVAAAMVHGRPADVERALGEADTVAPGTATLALALSWAAAGQREKAYGLAARLQDGALTRAEEELLKAVLSGGETQARIVEAAAAGETPVLYAGRMIARSLEGEAALAAREFRRAARAFSEVLLAELDAPWKADAGALARWTESLDAAQAEHRWNPEGDWPGVEVEVLPGDSLTVVRKRYLEEYPGAVVCTGLIARSNRLGEYIHPGDRLKIPTDPVRTLVDLDAFWTLYLIGDEVGGSWPVGIGAPGAETPTGQYVAKGKLVEPPWMPVGKEMIPYGDPRNPLGTRWIAWYQDGEKTSYGFHGTTEPESIGKASSDGCVRFSNEDVEELYEILPEDTSVLVRE